jgi:hypothetical protein
MNVYWASQHYSDLAGIRHGQGLPIAADTPPFLVQAHARAMDERADRGGRVEHKVRQIARRAMRRGRVGADNDGPGADPDDETDWKQAGTSRHDYRHSGSSTALADQGPRHGGEVG